LAQSAAKNKSGTLQDHETLVDLVSRVSEGVYITRLSGEIIDANPAMLDILGFSSLASLQKRKIFELVDPDLRAEQVRVLARDGKIQNFELLVKRPDGDVRWVLDSAHEVKDPETGEVTYRGIMHDITIRKRLESQLLEQSVRDPLTGSYNRRHLFEFERLMGDESWGCLVIDIDHFKHYNDTYGHQAGDEILIRTVKFLTRHLRADASVVRMGGDEFLVLLPKANIEQTVRTAERVSTAAGKEAPTPFSMGHATRADRESLEKTIHRADQNLYEVRTFLRAPNQERRKPQ
jgi:diguanylate cyclase (GGDEF)-like protein/PAS domain S-box-containing protein